MTLNLTALGTDFFVQVSDRRLTTACRLLLYDFGWRRQNQAWIDEPIICCWPSLSVFCLGVDDLLPKNMAGE